jgi:dTDP-4-amino-4,6-dideoxygalactose transaminase
VFRAQQAELEDAALRVLRSGWYVLGEEVARFEADFAEQVGSRDAVGVANGTDAVELALRGLGIGAGDAVLTVSHTAVATAVGVDRAGAVPLFVDVDETMTMCPESLQQAVRRARQELPHLRLRAVLPVHLYGLPAALDDIFAIADAEGLDVVEDCAQAHGAVCLGRGVGTRGAAAAFSFYPTKNLGAFGDGGAITTSDAAVAERLRRLRQYGWRERYISEEAGINSRLDELQAALLSVRLRRLREDNARRQAVATIYCERLAACALELPPAAPPGSVHAYHQFVVRAHHRDDLQAALAAHGVATSVLYPVPVHRQPAYEDNPSSGWPLHRTDDAAARVLGLPMHPHLRDDDVDQVVEAVRDAVQS